LTAWIIGLAARAATYVPVWKDEAALFAYAAERFPESGRARATLGNHAYKRGDLPLAAENLEAAIRIKSSLGEHASLTVNYLTLITILGKIGSPQAQKEMVARALTHLREDPAWFHAQVARICGEEGNWREGIDYARQAHELQPTSAEYVLLLAGFLQQDNRREEAIELLSGYDAQHPPNLEVIKSIASCQIDTRDFQQAERNLRRALEIVPQDGLMTSELGVVVAEQGRLDEALAILRSAAELAPGEVKPWANLAIATLRAGDVERARSYAEKLLRIDPYSEGGKSLMRAIERRASAKPAPAADLSGAEVK
jgi:tetratricopeptide (TPR) repeat protein